MDKINVNRIALHDISKYLEECYGVTVGDQYAVLDRKDVEALRDVLYIWLQDTK